MKNKPVRATASQMRRHISYNPLTGVLVWIKPTSRRNEIGGVAGTTSAGYRYIWFNYKKYEAHRVAYLLQTGRWPPADIDHKNMNGLDNRWVNLRAATRSQNKANEKARSNNTSGARGVHWEQKRRRWVAQIRVNCATIFLGRFTAFARARDAYKAAAKTYFGEFARD